MSKLAERYKEELMKDPRFIDPAAEAAELELSVEMIRQHVKSRLYTGDNYDVIQKILGEDLL
ncbi:hypothetical protein CPT_Summit_107 [Stenotrophomonas phage Summit]|nr:hypothetical protein CPT_Summit_107 [Stenotrophomonas phage Summit]